MKHPKNFYNHLFVIEDLGHSILKKLDDFINNIVNNSSIKKMFYNIDFVYMHSILLDLAKLISVTNADKSGLKQLKEISPKSTKDRIVAFESKYRDTIDKITSNRNKIISHVDISDANSYFKMGFSDIEIENKIEDNRKYMNMIKSSKDDNSKLIADLKKLKSISPKWERYSPSDFCEDIEIFKTMVNEVLAITRDLNKYFYNLD
jgi:hypothetical protein